MQESINSLFYQIDISDLSKGIYRVQIENEGKIQIEKLIIN